MSVREIEEFVVENLDDVIEVIINDHLDELIDKLLSDGDAVRELIRRMLGNRQIAKELIDEIARDEHLRFSMISTLVITAPEELPDELIGDVE